MQLQPQQTFVIVRQLDNPFDATTYYVRAVIRNSVTDAIIDTVSLTDKTSQRFVYPWQVIGDVSGQGTQIDITTTVYEDSAYTTISSVYGKQTQDYIVQRRVSQFHNGGVDA